MYPVFNGCGDTAMNSAAFIKQERQDDLRIATRTVAKRVEKYIEVYGGI